MARDTVTTEGKTTTEIREKAPYFHPPSSTHPLVPVR